MFFVVRHFRFAPPGDRNELTIFGEHPSCLMGKRQNIYIELLLRNVLRNSVSLYGTPRNFINMGCCRGRNILLFILVLQLLVVVERQVFDFLAFMWAPIIANFIHIAFLIVGIFGVYQYRSPYVITYSVWCLIWFGINLTIMSIYLEIDRLTHEDDWLSLKTGHQSWWAKNGIGCKPETATNDGTDSPTTDGCLLHFTYVESVQAGAECVLAFIGFWLGCWVSRSFTEEDDHFDYIGGFGSISAHHPPTKSSRMQMQPISS